MLTSFEMNSFESDQVPALPSSRIKTKHPSDEKRRHPGSINIIFSCISKVALLSRCPSPRPPPRPGLPEKNCWRAVLEWLANVRLKRMPSVLYAKKWTFFCTILHGFHWFWQKIACFCIHLHVLARVCVERPKIPPKNHTDCPFPPQKKGQK